jgi:hypothetical protein
MDLGACLDGCDEQKISFACRESNLRPSIPSAASTVYFHGVDRDNFMFAFNSLWRHGVANLVEALRYKPGGRGFYSRGFHWNFSLTSSFPVSRWPWG